MKYEVFCIRDSAIDAYLRPFYAVAKGQAMRIFADEINREQSDMFAHPADYELYYIGSWNDQNAQHAQTQTPELLARGQDVSTTRFKG